MVHLNFKKLWKGFLMLKYVHSFFHLLPSFFLREEKKLMKQQPNFRNFFSFSLFVERLCLFLPAWLKKRSFVFLFCWASSFLFCFVVKTFSQRFFRFNLEIGEITRTKKKKRSFFLLLMGKQKLMRSTVCLFYLVLPFFFACFGNFCETKDLNFVQKKKTRKIKVAMLLLSFFVPLVFFLSVCLFWLFLILIFKT